MTYASGTWGEKAKMRGKTRNEYFRQYRGRRDKNKLFARRVIDQMLKNGILVRGQCRDHGMICTGRIKGHHPDYNKPTEVIWLCAKHHREEHDRIDAIEWDGLYCLNCKVKIMPPKVKYCSPRCNSMDWSKTIH